MTSEDPSLLGIHQFLTHVEVGSRSVGRIGFALEIKFEASLRLATASSGWRRDLKHPR
jgi:hypothetical protein